MHIKKVELHRFKKYKDATITLKDELSLVVGGNNSGKSSILQALAAWQFCKTLIEIEKGREGWLQTKSKSGVGMGIVDFTPLQVPSLAHLWTNMKTIKDTEPDGYTLKIKVFWDIAPDKERYLEMGMSLANDRLFVKSTATNLTAAEIVDDEGNPISGSVPSVAYLPPFAGITDREGRLTPAMRERLIGQGLSGGVVRNVLFDLYEKNKSERTRLQAGRTKLKGSDLVSLRKNDPWEILTSAMQMTFGTDIKIVPFNERYHSYLKIECIKGKIEKGKFKKFPGYNRRDLMVEGQGFLQWLSVYALALSPEVNVVLLDEPDAHLNATLQKDLLQSLEKTAIEQKKQILMATHSPELIRLHEYERILAVGSTGTQYLTEPEGRIGILSGIGSIHTPTIHSLMQHERILILEAPSDLRFLKKLAVGAGFNWPKNVVPWYWTGTASERLQLFMQLKKEIPRLKGISIRDRDNEADSSVEANLIDKGFTHRQQDFTVMKWRRRHIENYLLCKAAIARAAGKNVADVEAFFAKPEHALAVPDDTTATDVALAIRDAHGKELMTVGNSIQSNFNITRDKVAEELRQEEIAVDLKTFFAKVGELSE